MDKLKMAQDILTNPMAMGGEWCGGFNSRILGDTYSESIGVGDRERLCGWVSADDMIKEGRLFYRHIFPHGCGTHSFSYGGMQVCNSCNRDRLEKPWWAIKVYKDGDAWCVVGLGFEDLQSSDNYAFGGTKDEALSAYQGLFSPPTGSEDAAP